MEEPVVDERPGDDQQRGEPGPSEPSLREPLAGRPGHRLRKDGGIQRLQVRRDHLPESGDHHEHEQERLDREALECPVFKQFRAIQR